MRPTTDEADWAGLLTGRSEPTDAVALQLWAGPVGAGGSQPLKAVDFNGRDWWVKPLTNGQGPMVTVTEYIVGRVGALIGAPVCHVDMVEITPDLATGDHPAGFANGSLDVSGAAQYGPPLQHRHDDDNRVRHVGVFALWDWCWGEDAQWLQDPSDQWRIYSHDHGFYLPPGGASWTVDALRQEVATAHSLAESTTGLDRKEIKRVATALNSVSRADLQDLLWRVPPSWVMSDTDIETLGWYLEQRAPEVAGRIAQLA